MSAKGTTWEKNIKVKYRAIKYPVLYGEVEAEFKKGKIPKDMVAKYKLGDNTVPNKSVIYKYYEMIMGHKYIKPKPVVKEKPVIEKKEVTNATDVFLIDALRNLNSTLKELNNTLEEINWAEVVPLKKVDEDEVA